MWRVSAYDRDGRECGRFELAEGELTIGRDSDRHLALSSPSISRRHARILIQNGQPTIVDDGSANGILVNGVRIASPTPVGPGVRIDLAEFRLSVEPLPLPVGGETARPPASTVRLVAQGGPFDGQIFAIADRATVGRSAENDLVFDNPSLSRRHARLERSESAQLEIEDLGSSNGTYVNGVRVARGSAKSGDTLRFGDLLFRVSTDSMGTGSIEGLLPATRRFALLGGGAATLIVLVFTLFVLVHKPRPVRASGREAITRMAHQAEQHLGIGRTLYRDHKYTEAKTELDLAYELDPANLEIRKLRFLTLRGPEDDRLLQAASASLAIGDRKALLSTLQVLEEIPDGSPLRSQLAAKINASLLRFGTEQCAERAFADCAWALCRAFQLAPDEPPDARLRMVLSEAERHLVHDPSYTACHVPP